MLSLIFLLMYSFHKSYFTTSLSVPGRNKQELAQQWHTHWHTVFCYYFCFFSIYSFLVFHLFFFLCLSCKLLTPKLCLMIYFWRVPQMKTWDLKCSLCTYPPFISRHLFLAQAHRQQTHWDLWHSGTGDSNFHLCIFAWSHT